MGMEEKINLIYSNLDEDSSISYDNFEDILDILLVMSEQIRNMKDEL